MPDVNINHNDDVIKTYYNDLALLKKQGLTRETNVRGKLFNVIEHYCKQLNMQLVEEWKIQGTTRTIDAAILLNNVPFGYIEAKDDRDILSDEVDDKIEKKYPTTNTLFWQPSQAILYRNDDKVEDKQILDAKEFVNVLRQFLLSEPRHVVEWKSAVVQFELHIPNLASELRKRIENEFHKNQQFSSAFKNFFEVCKNALNPNLRQESVIEMVIQHILIKRVFMEVFQYSEFVNRNTIAREIQVVVNALTSHSFSEDDFLKDLRFAYAQIGNTSRLITNFFIKQSFLNHFYELFFKLANPRIADTHGIVYTPKEVVNFMIRSVDAILKQEFALNLSSRNVHILDPFVGTGNFIHAIIKNISEQKGGEHLIHYKYSHELHANELTLMAYYIASMNIEHEFAESTGRYEPFSGLCLVDTFEIAEMTSEDQQLFQQFTEENSIRIKRQKESPIFVVIGNPPYNANQANENDNNKNRKYPAVDKRIKETYAKASKATSKTNLFDPYVRAFRYASDKLLQNKEGILAYVSNSSFLSDIAFDGMRKCLYEEFDLLYIIDLKGNVRKDSMRDGIPLGEQHTVFGLGAMVGICITIAVKSASISKKRILYHAVDFRATRAQKFSFLDKVQTVERIAWQEITPDLRNTWLREGLHDEFDEFHPMGNKDSKRGLGDAIFMQYCLGATTNRDVWAYNFNSDNLEKNITKSIEFYNSELVRWQNFRKSNAYTNRESKIQAESDKKKAFLILDEFVEYDEERMSWSRNLKNDLIMEKVATFSKEKIRISQYRPFCNCFLFYDDVMIEEPRKWTEFLPNVNTEKQNIVICLPSVGGSLPFHCLATNVIPDLHLTGDSQCFPLYFYTKDGQCYDNISDWGLREYQKRYGKNINKKDIFYYIYAVLHNKHYRTKYAANMKRDLPRIPFMEKEIFKKYVKVGRMLSELHVNYESQAEYPLVQDISGELNPYVRKVKMKIVKQLVAKQDEINFQNEYEDSQQVFNSMVALPRDEAGYIYGIRYNETLTLWGIPTIAFEYKLGNRSALDWIIERYRITRDEDKNGKGSKIENDPNRIDDPEYIIRLIKKVVNVSVETMKLINDISEFTMDNVIK